MKGVWVRVLPVFIRGILLLVFLSACAGTSQQTQSEGQTGAVVDRTIVGVVSGVVGQVGLVGVPRIILASVYDYLYKAGTERPSYGLYSYVLFPGHSPRAEHFLEGLFKTTSYVAVSLIDLENLNVIYLPTRADQLRSLQLKLTEGSAPSAGLFATQFYDYNFAQKLLAQICAVPADEIHDLCATDLSHGPYVFTYVRPASTLSPVPPPYLFLDLSNVHIRAFGEFIAAYKAQVKRIDYSDRERIDTLRLRVLNIVLTAADWIAPTKSAIADILHLARGGGG
jgi:hypothetical protein